MEKKLILVEQIKETASEAYTATEQAETRNEVTKEIYKKIDEMAEPKDSVKKVK